MVNMKVAKRTARAIGVILWMLGDGIAVSQQAAVKTATQTRVTVHIPPQPLRDALRVFAEQTQLQVVYRSEQIDPTALSAAVEGTYPAEQALALLLGTSALRAVRINARTLAIHVAQYRHKGDVVTDRE